MVGSVGCVYCSDDAVVVCVVVCVLSKMYGSRLILYV